MHGEGTGAWDVGWLPNITPCCKQGPREPQGTEGACPKEPGGGQQVCTAPLAPPCTLRGAPAQDFWTPLTVHSTGFQLAPSRAELVFPSPSTAAVSHQVAPLSPKVQAANWESLSVLPPNSLPLFSSKPLREFCMRILELWWQGSAEEKTLVQSPGTLFWSQPVTDSLRDLEHVLISL